MERETCFFNNKIKVNGNIYTLIRRTYDDFNECYFYYCKELDEPFCDLYDEIEVLRYD